jgi:hypothetical protein
VITKADRERLRNFTTRPAEVRALADKLLDALDEVERKWGEARAQLKAYQNDRAIDEQPYAVGGIVHIAIDENPKRAYIRLDEATRNAAKVRNLALDAQAKAHAARLEAALNDVKDERKQTDRYRALVRELANRPCESVSVLVIGNMRAPIPGDCGVCLTCRARALEGGT